MISAAVFALTIGRCPELLVHPRFYAEEGATYFAAAYQLPFLANLLSAHYGYYTLYNQLATSCATLVPLDHAPLVTTLMSLLVQVGISLYVLWGDLPLLETLPRRTILALAIPLLAWPGHWLTIIGSQCWFGVGGFLLLLAAGRESRPGVQAVRGGYVVLAGLTGVVTCFMAPAYFWRGAREKSGEYLAYGTLLVLCLLVHAGVLLTTLRSHSTELATRFATPDIAQLLGKTMVYQFAVPFTGRGVYESRLLVDSGTRFKGAMEALSGRQLPIHDLFVLPLLIGIAVMAMTLVVVVRNRSRLEVQVTMIALATVSLLSNLCSVNAAGGPRYYFIPSLMLLTLYLAVRELRGRTVQVIAAGLIVVTTLVGNGYEYRSIMTRQAYDPGYPDWHTELQAWRLSPAHRINIWPAPWIMDLNRRAAAPGSSERYGRLPPPPTAS